MMMCARLASSASKALKNSSCVRSLRDFEPWRIFPKGANGWEGSSHQSVTGDESILESGVSGLRGGWEFPGFPVARRSACVIFGSAPVDGSGMVASRRRAVEACGGAGRVGFGESRDFAKRSQGRVPASGFRRGGCGWRLTGIRVLGMSWRVRGATWFSRACFGIDA